MGTIALSLDKWLEESLRSRMLFGRHDEPLDEYGMRLVRVILEEARRAQPAPGDPVAQAVEKLKEAFVCLDAMLTEDGRKRPHRVEILLAEVLAIVQQKGQ